MKGCHLPVTMLCICRYTPVKTSPSFNDIMSIDQTKRTGGFVQMLNVDTLPQVGQEVATRAVPIKPIITTFLTSPEDTQGQKSETSWNENVRQIKDLLCQSQYKEAVLFGDKVRCERRGVHDIDTICSTTTRAEFDVHYAKALFYMGATEEAITMLKGIITEMECGRDPQDVARQSGPHTIEDWRWNWVLGQAHNHLGYTYWMNQDHCWLALQEFRKALPYFRASGLLEECANTSDNMGRVYALLHQRDEAERLIDEGLDLRLEFGSDYRVALSLNSRAIAHLTFEEPQQAHRLSTEALDICERLEEQRGIGLTCITQGRTLRRLGDRDSIYSHEKCITYLEQAAVCLKRAVGIFQQHVYEPVRLIEAYNELGCTYRDWAELIRHKDPDPHLVGHYHGIAAQHLRRAIELAEKQKNTLLCVDSCEDLARTYFQNRQFDAAERWLRSAEDTIPDMYKIVVGSGLRNVLVEECVEGFWYQMGKIELLRGHLAFDRGRGNSNGKVSRKVLVKATQHYALAIGYFRQYSKQAAETRTIFKQIYSRLKYCKSDDIRCVQDQALPAIARTYGLDLSDLQGFFLKAC
jgi:tetratricopeptide (TPR) repeat protein